MGALYIDGVLQPDPLPCRLPPELVGYFTPKAAPRLNRVQPLSADVGRMMDSAALSAIELMIDARARRYRRWPAYLDALQAGLSMASPRALIARSNALIEQAERGELPRWFGFGGENAEISLQAARRLGEWLLAEQAEEAA